VLGAAAGLERFYHYAWDNPRSGMIGGNGEELPNAIVMRKLNEWLLGSQIRRCRKMADVIECDGSKGSKLFSILWAERDLNHTMAIPIGRTISGIEAAYGDPDLAGSRRSESIQLRLGPIPLFVSFSAASGS
jgi:hypothetical protein